MVSSYSIAKSDLNDNLALIVAIIYIDNQLHYLLALLN
jgi:hypothetical protein